MSRTSSYYARRARAGGQSTLADASPAREVLMPLLERTSKSAIAAALGTSHNWVTDVVNGKIRRINPERVHEVQAIANLWPDGNAYVSAAYAARRLQALTALGYSAARLTSEVGVSEGQVKQLLRGQLDVVRGYTDARVREAYERLSMRLPQAVDHYEQGGIERARRRAAREGWAPPLAYDDIDNLDEQPAGVGYVASGRAVVIRDMAEMGAGVSEVCRRLRLGRKALEAYCRRHEIGDVYGVLVARETRPNQRGGGGEHAA